MIGVDEKRRISKRLSCGVKMLRLLDKAELGQFIGYCNNRNVAFKLCGCRAIRPPSDLGWSFVGISA
jgi:hypothetical protein